MAGFDRYCTDSSSGVRWQVFGESNCVSGRLLHLLFWREREQKSQGKALSGSDFQKADQNDLFFDRCVVPVDVLHCRAVYPRVALEADMAGCTDGDLNTFLLVVLYTWLEHGCAGDCMYHYRSNRLCIPRYIGFRYLHCRCSS